MHLVVVVAQVGMGLERLDTLLVDLLGVRVTLEAHAEAGLSVVAVSGGKVDEGLFLAEGVLEVGH